MLNKVGSIAGVASSDFVALVIPELKRDEITAFCKD